MPEQYPAQSIIKEYQNKIYHLALSISRNEKDAQDILQNTLIKIVRNISSFGNRSKLSTWIYRIAYNESLMYLRKKRRLSNSASAYKDYSRRDPGGLMVNWSKLPDQELLDSELRQRIDATLRDLPIQYRMPVLLHRLEGLSLVESARILGVRASTVKTRLHRAYLMLKAELGDYFKDRPQEEHSQEASCGVWTGFIYDYAQGKLDTSRKAAFKEHIQDCTGCNLFLDSYLQAIRITGMLDCRDVPAELKEKIQSFLSRLKK